MSAEDRRAALVGGDRRGDAGGEGAGGGGRIADNSAERALPREADDYGAAERGQDVEAADELEVLLDGLAEADARVEGDPLLRNAGVDGESQSFLEEGGDLGHNVVVGRILLHRTRLALHVHQAEVGAGLGDDLRQLRVGSERGYVVDELGVELERTAGDLGLRGIDRDRSAVQGFEHGDDAA
jgi:hypothetical protein